METFKTHTGATIKLPMLINYVKIQSVLGMKLEEPMSVHINELSDEDIKLMCDALAQAYINRKKIKPL